MYMDRERARDGGVGSRRARKIQTREGGTGWVGEKTRLNLRRQTQFGVIVESISPLLIVVFEWMRGD